jgi:hypothetical protein
MKSPFTNWTLSSGSVVDDTHASVELSAGDVVVHTLSSSKTIGQAEEVVEGRTRRKPQPGSLFVRLVQLRRSAR